MKVEIYQEVLRDVSQNFEGKEELIKPRIQEICNRKKNTCRRGNYIIYVYHIIKKQSLMRNSTLDDPQEFY